MKNLSKLICLVMAVLFALATCSVAFADEEYTMHPLLKPGKLTHDTATADRYTNILILGVDYGFDGYAGSDSRHKTAFKDGHADTFIVVSVNMNDGSVNLISIPQDTLAYIPSVQGMYKINASVNCGESMEDGFENARAAASWMLGGIDVEYYVAVDMNTMVKLCDHIGGADVDVEVSYTGASGRRYKKGMQHLDGDGLLDYARTWKKAGYDSKELERTSRQRQVIEGIMNTLAADTNKVTSVWDYANNGTMNFFTNLKLGTLINLFNKCKDSTEAGSYLMTGTLKSAAGQKFTFTDEANRQEVLKTVFGLDAKKLAYTDYDSVKWLWKTGFNYVHGINLAKSIVSFGKRLANRTAEQDEALTKLETAYNDAVTAFNKAATTRASADNSALKAAVKVMTAAGNEASTALAFSEKKLSWNKSGNWIKDTYINEYVINWK